MPIAGPIVCGEEVVFRAVSFGWVRLRPGKPPYVHEGMDFYAPIGAEIHAPFDGVVDRVGAEADGKPGGNRLRLHDARGDYHYFAHLLFEPLYRPGDPVRLGDLLGWVGRSGAARDTEAHLHYEVMDRRGRKRNPYAETARVIDAGGRSVFRGPVGCPRLEIAA